VIEVVFFDAGETILHPHPSFPELFSSVCREHGYDVPAEDVAPVLYGMVRNFAGVAQEARVESPSLSSEDSYRFWTYLYSRCLEELSVPDNTLPDELYKVFSDVSTYRLYDDALPVLRELSSQGYRLGLISNFEGWLEELLVELEVGHIFDVSIISGLEGIEKPDPGIYELALERAGTAPKAALHVGDSFSMDVEPATAVGMNAVLLDRSRRHPSVDSPTIASLHELPMIVARL
jgi:putative hydrolase of the HAD superfamily